MPEIVYSKPIRKTKLTTYIWTHRLSPGGAQFPESAKKTRGRRQDHTSTMHLVPTSRVSSSQITASHLDTIRGTLIVRSLYCTIGVHDSIMSFATEDSDVT